VLSLLSLGAVAENLSLAAGRFQMKADPEWPIESTRDNLAFYVRWQPGEAPSDPLSEAITKRHTNRRLIFRGPRLSREDLVRLRQIAADRPGCSLIWLDDTPRRRQTLRLMRLAEAERFHNPLLHKDLFSAIRFDVGWQQSCDEGLPPGALGIERPLRLPFALLRHWSIMHLVNMVGGYHLLGWRAASLPCRISPHVGLISAADLSDQAVFNAGRGFERVWLLATLLGLALQPMPAAALYALDGACKEGIPARVQSRLRQGWQTLLRDQTPLMLFRIGYASPPAIYTIRKPLEYYTSLPADD